MGTEGEEDGKEAEPRYVCSDVVCCRQVVPLVRDLLKKEGKNRRVVKILCTEREREGEIVERGRERERESGGRTRMEWSESEGHFPSYNERDTASALVSQQYQSCG